MLIETRVCSGEGKSRIEDAHVADVCFYGDNGGANSAISDRVRPHTLEREEQNCERAGCEEEVMRIPRCPFLRGLGTAPSIRARSENCAVDQCAFECKKSRGPVREEVHYS